MATPQRLNVTLLNLDVHDRLCMIYETIVEKFNDLLTCIRKGVDWNDKCFCVGSLSPVIIIHADLYTSGSNLWYREYFHSGGK
jgi:hypothetical protein